MDDLSNILFKIGHFTLDNAANNQTMMEALARKLEMREIAFDPVDRRIMCFAHIIDLSSGRVISNITEDDADASAPGSNAIKLPRAVVQAIRASGSRREAFNDVVKNGNAKGWFKSGDPRQAVILNELQLLRDVRTRWDSVYRMLDRLREMRPVPSPFSCYLIITESSY